MTNIKLFQDKKIRSAWNEEEQQWYFSVIDVVEVLTDSSNSRDYWFKMKKREKIAGIELSTICRQLKLESSDGKKYKTDYAKQFGGGDSIFIFETDEKKAIKYGNAIHRDQDLIYFT